MRTVCKHLPQALRPHVPKAYASAHVMVESNQLGAKLFKFGVCSDLQWAEVPDGQSHGGAPRRVPNVLHSTA